MFPNVDVNAIHVKTSGHQDARGCGTFSTWARDKRYRLVAARGIFPGIKSPAQARHLTA